MEEEKKAETEQEPELSDNSENEDLRNLIMEQLTCMEPSDVSDEEGYQARLSCILEDDESESSTSQSRSKEFPKNEASPRKTRERDKTSGGSESGDNAMTLRDLEQFGDVQVTDLDELSSKNSDESPSEKTEIQMKTDDGREVEDTDGEEEEEAEVGEVPFAIKKLKSSDNVLERKFVPKRAEFSSDSSDIDISISNERPGEVTASGSDAARTTPEDKSESPESWLFPKVSRSYLEKAGSRGEVTEEESGSRAGSIERELLSPPEGQEGQKRILQVVHLRSKSPRVYTPPIPPETYLWEELKRIRGKGGYPWTYLDKPPFDEAAWKKYMEHEYEPINPPPLSVLRRREGEKEEEVAAARKQEHGIPPAEEHIRIPDKKPKAEAEKNTATTQGASATSATGRTATEDSKTEEDMEVEEIAVAQNLQDEIEGRFLAHTPTTTTASRTDGDVNTSMLDSSGMEDIPLKRASRAKVRTQAHGIHQKLRSQAGKIRSKFRNLPRPSLSARERQKEGAAQQRTRFRLPERPKFNFPEKARFSLPDFKLPDASKFSLPERPKFHLPERPKLHLPERPKIHLPERPKFHLPERPKFNLPERPKLHLPERSKIHLPERPKLHLPEMSKFHLPERPKLHLPERPKINLSNFVRPLRERQQASQRRNIFDLDFKSYPKIFSKKARQRPEYTTSSPKKTRGITPPPKMRSEQPTAPERKKVPVGQRWVKKMDDIKYADDDVSVEVRDSRRSDRSESLSDFRDKDLGGYMEDLDDSRFPPGGRKTLSTKSSTSHMSERDVESLGSSDGKLRKGVLEEIDSDEFFLRQKGISQEDIDMGKYLSHEIREAFRSPEVNALARMNYDYEEDLENEPRKPDRPRSLKKHFESDPALSDNAGYKTYPPRRPTRKSRSQSKSLVNEEAIIGESVPVYENQYQEDNISEYYKAPGPVKEYVHYKVPRPIADSMPVPYRRKKAAKKKLEEAAAMESEPFDEPPPQPLVRRKSKKRLDKKESADEDVSRGEDEEKLREHEYVVPDEAPIPPRRTRSLTRSLRSSRSFRSDVDESREVIEPQFTEQVDTRSLSQGEMARPHHYEATEDDPGFGYATIGKPLSAQKEKPQRPPPPRRKRDLTSIFHTVPRRTPVRPMRNYSTLGPSRPPRKSKFRSDDRLSQAYIEMENESAIKPLRYEESHGSNKDLQKEEVIEKMKTRPLPPPPRPPRQKSRGPDDLPEPEESEEAKISMALLKGEAVPVEVEALVHSPPAEDFRKSPVEEVCVSTQTDPVPDDFLVDVEDEIIQEFSHEQLKLQQAFLEELKNETEEAVPSTTKQENTNVQERLEMELLAQLQKEAERDKNEPKKGQLETFDVDQGYASLDRRQHKQEPEPSTSGTFPQAIRVPVIPDIQTSVQVLRTDKLDVKELEVERLSVKEVQAHGIHVSSLHTNQLTAEDVSSRSGNLSLGNVELPPAVIQQIVEKIPWEELRPTPSEVPGRRYMERSEPSPSPRRHRRHRRASSTSEEDRREDGRPHRSRHSARSQNQSVTELSKQLATACAASGARAVQSIASRMQTTQIGDKTLLMKVILCVLALLIAGFLLLGCEKQTVLHHHWDFQFPPQPPPRQF